MIDKILLFGMPRTATTVLQMHLSKYYNLLNLSEAFNEPAYGFNPNSNTYNETTNMYDWIANQKTCSVKLLATTLFYVDLLKIIEAGEFNLFVVTKRKNLTDCCISLYLAEKIQKYHHYDQPLIEPFVCDLEFIKKWIYVYNEFFLTSLAQMEKLKIKYYTVFYEDYLSGKDIVIDSTTLNISDLPSQTWEYWKYIDTKIEYKKLCTNYKEVNRLIIENCNG